MCHCIYNYSSILLQHLALKCPGHSVEMTIADLLQVHVGNYGRAMVFCETKREADRLAISSLIKQETHVLHGDIPQDKREMVLQVNGIRINHIILF